MNSTPKVSVILPTYNQVQYLPAMMESIVSQSFTDYELIVVNDGSTDGTAEYLERINHKQIKIIHQKNSRLPKALNKGIGEAKGEYITWVSSDNICAHNFLQVLAEALDAHPEADLVYSGYCNIDEGNNRLNIVKNYGISLRTQIFSNLVGASFMYRRKCHEQFGMYDHTLEGAEDWDFWNRLLLNNNKAIFIPDILYFYRIHSKSMTSTIPQRVRDNSLVVVRNTFEKTFVDYDISKLYPSLSQCMDTDKAYWDALDDLGCEILKCAWPIKNLAVLCFKKAHEILPDETSTKIKYLIALFVNKRYPELQVLLEKCSYEEKKTASDIFKYIESQGLNFQVIMEVLPFLKNNKKKSELFNKELSNLFFSKSRQKNVLIVSHNFPPYWFAGVENYVHDFAKALQSEAYEITVMFPVYDPNITRPVKEECYYNDLRVIKLKSSKAYDIQYTLNSPEIEEIFKDIISNNKYDVVHFQHTLHLPMSLVKIAKSFQKPVCLTLHDFWLTCPRVHLFIAEGNNLCTGPESIEKCMNCLSSGGYNIPNLSEFCTDRMKASKEIFNLADIISSPSKYLANKFKEFGYDTKNVTIASLGIKKIELKDINRTEGGLRFFYLGTIHKLKNIDLLVDAFLQCSGNATLDIWGNGSKEAVNALKEKISVNTRITYNGGYSPNQLADILSKADVVVTPSIIENYPLVVREALSAGIPVVASRVGGIPEIIHHEENGILFNPENRQELINIMQKIINDPSVISTLKKNIKPMKSMEDDAREWSRRYDDLLSEGCKPEISVSIIIPVYNKLEFTMKCLDSIYKNADSSLNYEVILIDNASTDGTNEYLKNYQKAHSNITVLSSETNLGFARANNFGVKYASGEYVLFLNNDTEPKENWLGAMLEVFEKYDNVGAVGSKLLFPDGTIQHAGVLILKDEWSRCALSPLHVQYQGKDDSNVNSLRTYKTVTAACLLMKKSVFEGCGGFDENYWNGYEDVDLCFKLLKEGYDIYYQPESVVVHFESQSGPERFSKEDSNHWYLSEKWKGKIIPDVIRRKSGENSYYSDASIIIVTYNSAKTIVKCLESVVKTIRKYDEVIVVDNNSRDNTVQKIKTFIKNKENFKLIESGSNLGFSAGTNLGIKNSNNPYVVILNPDTVITMKWLERLYSHFDNRTAAVGPISNYVAARQRMDLYWKEPVSLKAPPDEIAAKYYEWNKSGSVETKLLIGFCMMIRRDVVDELGMLDETLFLGNDDLELSWRFRANGYRLKVATDTYIYHEGQHSFNTESKSTTGRLVQESTDALYNKLVKYYGPDNIPSPMEMWEINWFNPSTPKFNSSAKFEDMKLKPGKDDLYVDMDKKNLVSIVILTYNGLKYNKECIASIQKYTKTPYELIVIDNASQDETPAYLEELAKTNSKVKVILNKENLGFPKGVNQGIKLSKGSYVLLANNDIVVTEGWLERMLEVSQSEDKIGIVGPISNEVSGYQKDKDATYKNITEMHKYAKKIRKNFKGVVEEFPRVAFLCTLIKKELIDELGGLDERFTPGNYEDDDFCLRAQIAGYKTVVAKDVFIHHYGSKSFTAQGAEKYLERLKINEKKFIDKWGATPDEIWIQGKNIKKRSVHVPVNVNKVVEMFERAKVNIEDSEYESALNNLEAALNLAETSNDEAHDFEKGQLLNLAGNISLVLHDMESAKAFFEKELQDNPQSSTACQGLADVFFANEEYESAKVMYEWAVKNDKTNSKAQAKLKEVNVLLGLPEHDNSLQESEVSFEESFIQACNMFESGDAENALLKIEEAESCYNPESSAVTLDEIKVLKGSVYLTQGDLENARLSFEDALKENPQSSEACLGLGTIFYQSGMPEEAKVMLEWAAKNDPQNRNALNSLSKVNHELGYDEQHSALNDNAENSELSEFESEFNLAYGLFSEEKYQEALLKLFEAETVYDETAQSSINLEDVNVLKGSIYLILNEDNKARISFEKALNLNPESSEACRGLAEIFFRADMLEEARTMFEWAVKNNPADESAIARLETISGIIGAGSEVISEDENPSNKEIDSAISEAYQFYQNKQFNDSISKLLLAGDLLDEVEHEAEKHEYTAVIENMKGMNYLGVKKVDKAKAAFSRALEINPQSSQACAGLGEVFFLCEMDKEAKTMFEWALKNDESNQFALTGLRKVNQILGYNESDNSLLN